jgi:hypothetical protein
MATGYVVGNVRAEVRVPVGSTIVISLHRPGRLCGSPNLLSDGFRGSFLGVKAAEVVKLTTNHETCVYTSTSPIHLHGEVLN